MELVMSPHELNALVQLLNRCPMSLAEQAFVQSMVNKIENNIKLYAVQTNGNAPLTSEPEIIETP